MKKIAAIALTGAVFDLGILVVSATVAPAAEAGKLRGKITKPGDGGMKTATPCCEKSNGAQTASVAAQTLHPTRIKFRTAHVQGAPARHLKGKILRPGDGGMKRAAGTPATDDARHVSPYVRQKHNGAARADIAAAAVATDGDGRTDVARSRPKPKAGAAGKADLAVFRPASKE